MHWDSIAEMIYKSLAPGPYTLILPAKESVPKTLLGGGGTLGIRICDHPLLTYLLEIVGEPITSTSANISGDKPATSWREVPQNIGIDLILKGECTWKMPSTVIDVSNLQILRRGAGLKLAEEVLQSIRIQSIRKKLEED